MEQSQVVQLGEDNPNPAVEIHVTGAVTYMNPAAKEQFPDLPGLGFQHPLLVGLPEIIARLHTDAGPSIQREVRTGISVYDQKIVVGKGSDFIRLYMNDVTARKQTEAELQMANLSLVNVVAVLQQSKQRLHMAKSQLIQAEKMGAVGQLASGIAHEVKNPLGIIMQGINYLEQELSPDYDQRAEVLRMMKDAVFRADKIVRGLLDFARPAPIELKPVAIDRVIDTALDLVGRQLAVENIRVVSALAPGLPVVMLDENQMKQAFINLILNAFQAMPQGGQLTIRAFLQTLTQLGGRVGRRATDAFKVDQTVLVCELQDTGRGIPEQVLPRAFDPFFTTKPPGQGTGLGLAVTKTIIEEHRGLIELASKEGHGTTVTILLPIPNDRRNHSTIAGVLNPSIA